MQAHQLRLLHTVRCGRDIGDLMRRGLVYHQIASLIQASIADGLLAWQNGDLILTEKGGEQLAQGKLIGISGGSSEWIVPAEDHRIDRLDSTDVYLPRPGWKRE